MESEKVVAQIYQTICPRCNASVEFPIFEACFYNFATYQYDISGLFLRLDLDACHYQAIDPQQVISQVVIPDIPTQAVSHWIELPAKIKCHKCGEVFDGPDSDFRHGMHREDHIEAFLLPA